MTDTVIAPCKHTLTFYLYLQHLSFYRFVFYEVLPCVLIILVPGREDVAERLSFYRGGGLPGSAMLVIRACIWKRSCGKRSMPAKGCARVAASTARAASSYKTKKYVISLV